MYQERELGPGSQLWRYAGDSRIGMVGATIGILQLMHPGIGAGVLEHSNFFEDPYDRVFRSLPWILGVVYDEDAEATGRTVRNFHAPIKGVDDHGRRYSALDPETYWWAHATFQFMAEQVADRFARHHLTGRQREDLYLDGIEWYRRYAVSMAPVPPTRREFQAKWDHVCAEVLEMNPAVEFVLEHLDGQHAPTTLPPPLARLQKPLRVKAVRKAAFVPVRITAIGGLPPIVRERFGIRWTRADQAALDAIEIAVRNTWRFQPFSQRWQPRAAEAWKRTRRAAAA